MQLALTFEPAAPEVRVPVTRDVLVYGASSRDVPRHTAVVAVRGVSSQALEQMLALADDALRYNQVPRARLDTSARNGAGSNGPIGAGRCMADSRGIRHDTGETATWPQLLKALQARRDEEPHIARAQDLAEAYHYLRYYAFAYGDGPQDAPPALLDRIRAEIVELGGDPALVNLTDRWGYTNVSTQAPAV